MPPIAVPTRTAPEGIVSFVAVEVNLEAVGSAVGLTVGLAVELAVGIGVGLFAVLQL